jgi:hypothetical protein
MGTLRGGPHRHAPHELNALGVVFVSLTEPLDSSTPSGGALTGMLAVFAEFERDLICERMLGGFDRGRREGTRLDDRRRAGTENGKCHEQALELCGCRRCDCRSPHSPGMSSGQANALKATWESNGRAGVCPIEPSGRPGGEACANS